MSLVAVRAPPPWVERILALRCARCGGADVLDASDIAGQAAFYEAHDGCGDAMSDAFSDEIRPNDLVTDTADLPEPE